MISPKTVKQKFQIWGFSIKKVLAQRYYWRDCETRLLDGPCPAPFWDCTVPIFRIGMIGRRIALKVPPRFDGIADWKI
jgi:hypothetical protein